MDKKEYLRRKEKIRRYRHTGLALLIIGIIGGVSFVVGIWIWLFRVRTLLFLIATICYLIVLFVGCGLGEWWRNKARDLEIELEVYDKERERRKAQQPIMAGKYQ